MRCAALAVALALAPAAAAAAGHPLGNFTVNRYAALDVGRDVLAVHYVVVMVEIAAFQEIRAADANGDGTLDAAEGDAYLARMAGAIRDALVATLDGTPLGLVAGRRRLELPPGAGGLPTLRIEIDFVAALPAPTGRVAFDDRNFAGRAGWQEVVARAADGLALAGSSVPTRDRSEALRAYPADLLATPPQVTAARFDVVTAPGGTAPTANEARPAAAPVARAGAMRFSDRMTELVATRTPLGPGLLLVSLLAAAGLGALHALAPGHGKTVVAAYLVGTRGTARHALLLGLVVTLTHTLGVYVLGLAMLGASRWVVPERLFPWLGVASGLLVLGIGGALLLARLADVADGHAHGPGADHHHHHHHHHHHDDDHADDHVHRAPDRPLGWRALVALGVSGGLLPCPSAMVVMLGAIGLGRVAFGLVLIVAFSAGLATVLTAVGIAFVHARRLLDRVPAGGRLLRVAPVVSALAISLAGLAIVMQALRTIGA